MVLQKAARLHRWFCFSLAWWGIGGLARGMAETEIHVDYTLSRIDQGVAWVSPYWGYNTPKLVGDGDAFYRVALRRSPPCGPDPGLPATMLCPGTGGMAPDAVFLPGSTSTACRRVRRPGLANSCC